MQRMKRRDVLKVGALGAGLTLNQYFQLADAGLADTRKSRSAILIFLKGGPSHQDTFDMKSSAPVEFRGEFQPIKTNVQGVEFCEHLPKLARMADKFAILRGISHNLADHGIGTRYLLTGNRPIPTLRYPEFGCVASKVLPITSDLPTAVAIEEELEGPGFLGTQYGSLATGDRPRPNQPFSIRGITLSDGMTVSQLDRRWNLARDVDSAFRGYEDLDDQVASLDSFAHRAYQIISSRRSREAFDLGRESPAIVHRFGQQECGLGLLLALRLIAAGVRFVTVIVDGWDTHNDNFNELRKNLLPRFDQGFSALLQTLDERGLLDCTALMVTGEFGRTPKVNGRTGRDHWAQAMFTLMAGGDVRGGQTLGATDDKAAQPSGDGFTPDDVAASFYHNIGINPRKEYYTSSGRPVMLVRDGNIIKGMFTG